MAKNQTKLYLTKKAQLIKMPEVSLTLYHDPNLIKKIKPDKNGEIQIKTNIIDEKFQPFKAMEIITAIGRGFPPEKAMRLLKGENTLHVIDLREFVGKSSDQIDRIRGRIIGEGGKARKNMENLSNTSITVYGRTVSIIGGPTQLKLAVDAIESLSSGSMHGHVYKRIESSRRQEKFARMQLWEDQNVF